MRSKILLIAQRELQENVRTKTFWIGILMLPIILIASFGVQYWLEKNKSTRYYAVIDQSGWVLDEVEKRAAMPDLEKVFRQALDLKRAGGEAYDALPTALQQSVEQLDAGFGMMRDMPGLPAELRDLDDEALEDKVLENYAKAVAMLDRPEGEQIRQMMPPQALDQLLSLRRDVSGWWQSLPGDEAEDYGGKATNKSRYRRVDVEAEGLSGDTLLEELNRRVSEEELFAYFVINRDPVANSIGSKYVSTNLTDEDLREWFANLASDVVRERRLAKESIADDVARWVQEPLDFDVKKIGAGGEEEEVETQDLVRQWAPVAFVYLLWIAVFTIVQMLLTNTVEEKSNRIMEVLLSSVSPLQLMAGKILGIASTGIAMVSAWGVFFYLVVKFLPPMLGLEFGFDLGAIISEPRYLLAFVVYFLLGYLLYASLLVGIGSVCNSLKEAQNLMQPVVLLLMIPLFTMMPIAKDPNGLLAKALSYVPPFTPFVMMNRAAAPPTLMEYFTTTALLAVSVALALWAAAKIFRIGILMTGKAPKPMEILRWLRAPVGVVPERKS